MKAILFVLLILIVFVSCTTIQPIAQDVCRIADDICFYQTQLCAMVNDTTFSQLEIDSLSFMVKEKQTELNIALQNARVKK